MPAILLTGTKLGYNGPFAAPKTGTSFGNFIYTAIFCHVIPLSYTISNFKPCSRSLEDKKQFCRSYLHLKVYVIYRWHPKTNNQVRFILTLLKNNSEYSFIFPETPVKALCLMMQSLNQPTLLFLRGSGMLAADSNCSYSLSIMYYIFLSSKQLA